MYCGATVKSDHEQHPVYLLAPNALILAREMEVDPLNAHAI